MANYKLAIVAANFNRDVVDVMIETAKEEAATLGATVTTVVTVPGSYEMPIVVDKLLARPDVDGLVTLGYIERGSTLHGEVMGHVVHSSLVDLQLKYKKPVGIGIIGPGALLDQAHERKIPYARASIKATLQIIETLKGI